MNAATYLETFFAEKNLASKVYEVEHAGSVHLVETEIVIDLLVKGCGKQEQEGAANILRKIDFANGDVHHFLAHLAKGYVVNNF